MSLHQLAQHAAKAGRHGDSTLVHMSPKEVAGLQALAVKNGTSMTVNPVTGLPEAFNLNSLLPVLAGAALGPAGFGLFSSAMGAAAAVGGITALTSGSLEKGLMAGLGAYGGSNLASGFGAVGADSAMNAAEATAREAGSAGQALADARSAALTQASANPFSTMASGLAEPSKLAGAMGGYGNVAQAAFPVVAPMLADQATQTTTKMPSNGYIRNFDYDPMTQTARALAPVRTADLGYAAGGVTGAPQTVTQMPGNQMTGNSRSAYDYLMGLAPASAPRATTRTPDATASIGRYVWDAATKSYKWVAAGAPAIAPVETGGQGTLVDTGGGGASSNSNTSSTAANSNSMGLAGIANSLGLTQDISNVPVSTLDTMSPAAAAESAAQDSASQASDTAATATTGPSGTGAAAAAASAAASAAAAATGVSDAAVAAAGQAAADAAVAGDGPAAAAAAGAAAAAAAAAAGDAAASTSSVGDAPGVAAVGDAPSGDAPSGDAPSGDAPSGDAPSGDAPSGDAPSGDAPSGDAPGVATGDGAASAAGDAAAAGGDGGGGGGGGGGGCFLTTAAVSHMKQKDNGDVLSTLRDFRDTYMRKNKEKSKDVAWYYENAPHIVRALDARPDADKVYKKMYREYIKPAYNAIQEGDEEYAYEIYKDGIDFAKKHSGIGKKELTPRYGPHGMATGGITALAGGGLGQLGGYSDGGQLLRGPGDGVSDSIPATIGHKQPARLADGEFVVPARIVSELGNGSTEAGARKLYQMMDRIQSARSKTVGKGRVAKNSRADKYLPG